MEWRLIVEMWLENNKRNFMQGRKPLLQSTLGRRSTEVASFLRMWKQKWENVRSISLTKQEENMQSRISGAIRPIRFQVKSNKILRIYLLCDQRFMGPQKWTSKPKQVLEQGPGTYHILNRLDLHSGLHSVQSSSCPRSKIGDSPCL